MDSDKDVRPFEREFNAVVVSYLDGHLELDDAAERLAAMIRAQRPRPRTTKEQTEERELIEEWGNEGTVLIVPRVFAVAPDRASDHDRIGALLKAAMLRVLRCPRCGSSLPPPEGHGLQKIKPCSQCGWQYPG